MRCSISRTASIIITSMLFWAVSRLGTCFKEQTYCISKLTCKRFTGKHTKLKHPKTSEPRKAAQLAQHTHDETVFTRVGGRQQEAWLLRFPAPPQGKLCVTGSTHHVCRVCILKQAKNVSSSNSQFQHVLPKLENLRKRPRKGTPFNGNNPQTRKGTTASKNKQTWRKNNGPPSSITHFVYAISHAFSFAASAR